MQRFEEPRLETSEERLLAGKHLSMSLTNNRTRELWQDFVPYIYTIPGRSGSELISLQVYNTTVLAKVLDPDQEYIKWAAVQISSAGKLPPGIETFTVPGGLYAVFDYKGMPEDGEKIFRFIFESWLPESHYELDDRPHFEVLGAKYKNGSPDSEEEIWIPIKLKSIKKED